MKIIILSLFLLINNLFVNLKEPLVLNDIIKNTIYEMEINLEETLDLSKTLDLEKTLDLKKTLDLEIPKLCETQFRNYKFHKPFQ